MLKATDLKHGRLACRNDGAMVHVQACWCLRSWSRSAASLVMLHGMQAAMLYAQAQSTCQEVQLGEASGLATHRSLSRAELTHGEACAGVLVLEELEHARARGAPILAEFLGGSFTCDAHHMTEPQPQGAGVKLCIERWAPGLPTPQQTMLSTGPCQSLSSAMSETGL